MPFKAKDEFKAWRNIWQITHIVVLVIKVKVPIILYLRKE